MFPDQCAGAAGQLARGIAGRARQRGGRGVGQVERAGGAGRERGVAGERELRGEEQLSPELSGIRAGSVGEVERAGDQGAEV